jgi:hypothetical protein
MEEYKEKEQEEEEGSGSHFGHYSPITRST